MGCYFLLQCMKVKSESEVSQPYGLQPTRLLCPWDFPGKSIGVGCPCFLPTKPHYSKFQSTKVVWLSSRPVGGDHPAATTQHERHRDKSGP